MSNALTVIGGVHQGGTRGLISIPVAAGLDHQGVKSLQTLLSQLGIAVAGSSGDVAQLDVGGKSGLISVPPALSGAVNILEFTAGSGPSGSNGSGSTQTPSGSAVAASVPGGYRTVIVQAPGELTLTGSSMSGGTYLLGAASDVALTAGAGSGSVIAAGGQDTLDLNGAYSASVIGGSAAVTAAGAADTIDAYGAARTTLVGAVAADAQLRFINDGSGTAFVSGGGGSVTVFGGAGGGIYQAGAEGNSSLIGGVGGVDLQGVANGDVLEAGMSTGGATVSGINRLAAGAGNETLFASSATGVNVMFAGIGHDQLQSDGTMVQEFVAGSGYATMSGSTQPGATNIFMFGIPSAAGGHDVINNFRLGHDLLFAEGNASITGIAAAPSGSGTGTVLSLGDGTTVLLHGIDAAQVKANATSTILR